MGLHFNMENHVYLPNNALLVMAGLSIMENDTQIWGDFEGYILNQLLIIITDLHFASHYVKHALSHLTLAIIPLTWPIVEMQNLACQG